MQGSACPPGSSRDFSLGLSIDPPFSKRFQVTDSGGALAAGDSQMGMGLFEHGNRLSMFNFAYPDLYSASPGELTEASAREEHELHTHTEEFGLDCPICEGERINEGGMDPLRAGD